MSRRAVGLHILCEADGSSIAAVEKYDGSVLAAGIHHAVGETDVQCVRATHRAGIAEGSKVIAVPGR